MSNVFDKAKKTAVATPKAKKDEKVLVKVAGAEFAEKLAKFAVLKAQLDEMEAELEMAHGFVKATGIDEYAKLVEKTKVNSGSFLLGSDKGGSVMFLPTKKYIKLDEARANELKATYGEDVVDEKTTYGFNPEILESNMDAIAAMIEKSDLPADVKDNLISATVVFKVKDDTLDKVYTLAKESGRAVADVLEDIKPVYMLKSPKAGK